MYRIVNENDEFFIQITAEETTNRDKIFPNVDYSTLVLLERGVFRGFHSFDSLDDAESHIQTLTHKEWFIPHKTQSLLPTLKEI